MSSSGLQVSENLQYNKIPNVFEGSSNFVSFKPVGPTTYSQDSEIKIRISSQDYLNTSRSYIKYRLKWTGGTTTDQDRLSKLGGVSVLRNVAIAMGGLEVERINNYNAYCGLLYKRLPLTNQAFLKATELFDDRTGANAANGAVIVHALKTAVFESNRHLPLAFIRGGIELSLTLEGLNRVLSDNAVTPPTGFEISEVEFIGCMVSPPAEYLQETQKMLMSGASQKLPLVLIRNVRSSPSGITDEEKSIHLGLVQSLRSVIGTFRTDAILNGANGDSFRDSVGGLESYAFRIGSTTYPKNKRVGCSTENAGASDPESLMQAICSLDNTYPHFLAKRPSENGEGYVYYNFASNASVGSGVAVSDGILVNDFKYHTAPATTTSMDAFYHYDAYLLISAEEISVVSRNLEAI